MTRVLQKLRYAPWRDLLRGRVTGRSEVKRLIRESGLPPFQAHAAAAVKAIEKGLAQDGR